MRDAAPRLPGVTPHHVPVKRSHIDLVPTVILDLLSVPAPEAGELSGRSLMPDLFAQPGDKYEERDVYIDMPVGPYTGMRHALITGETPGMKFYNLGPNAFALFDLADDPGEANDIVLADPDRGTTLDAGALQHHPRPPQGDRRPPSAGTSN